MFICNIVISFCEIELFTARFGRVANGWGGGGQTRHVYFNLYFTRREISPYLAFLKNSHVTF